MPEVPEGLFFVAGAAGGALLGRLLGVRAALAGCVLLAAAFVLLFAEEREEAVNCQTKSNRK